MAICCIMQRMRKNRPPPSQAVRLSFDLVDRARQEAFVMQRSMTEQLEHWARVGLAIEQQPTMSLDKVRSFLVGRTHFDHLSEEERAVALAEFERRRKDRGPAKQLQQDLASGTRFVSDGRGGVRELPPQRRTQRTQPARAKPAFIARDQSGRIGRIVRTSGQAVPSRGVAMASLLSAGAPGGIKGMARKRR